MAEGNAWRCGWRFIFIGWQTGLSFGRTEWEAQDLFLRSVGMWWVLDRFTGNETTILRGLTNRTTRQHLPVVAWGRKHFQS